MEVVLDALKRENEQLRGRLTDTERDYIRMKRMNEIYREELIEHRRRVSRYAMNRTFANTLVTVAGLACGQLDRTTVP